MSTLTGKTALVTGASRGMVRASALALAAAGAQVLVHYGRGAKEADGVVAEIRKGGGRADAIAMDLAPSDGAGKLADRLRQLGRQAWVELDCPNCCAREHASVAHGELELLGGGGVAREPVPVPPVQR